MYGGFRCAAELAAFFEAEGASAVAQLETRLVPAGGADGANAELAAVLCTAARSVLSRAQRATKDKALGVAAAAGDLPEALDLVASGADTSWQDERGNTVFSLAAGNEHRKTARVLFFAHHAGESEQGGWVAEIFNAVTQEQQALDMKGNSLGAEGAKFLMAALPW